MTLNCMTKINGVYYPAGAEVPVGNNKPVDNKEIKETVVEEPKKQTKQKASKKTEEVVEE